MVTLWRVSEAPQSLHEGPPSTRIRTVGTIGLPVRVKTSCRGLGCRWLKPKCPLVAGDILDLISVRAGMEEMFEDSEHFYLVLELVSGGELFEHLIRNGAYSEQTAAAIIRDLAGALRFLHRKGIVHGDLKPENLMLSSWDDDNARVGGVRTPKRVVHAGYAQVLTFDYPC